MAKTLVIVESPAKIKTLKQFLGSGYELESSYGHIRDLPESEFGIDVENDFEPKYVMMPDKKEVIAKLQKAAAKCDMIYLSPDPDREGEAIAWHISELLPKEIPIKRVVFNSITKNAVKEALQSPKDLDMSLVNAQQARRLLDRLVGYTISPLLNKRLKRGKGKAVSAGRVQSVALKLVVDRERAILAFIPQEYWTISVDLLSPSSDKNFSANLISIDSVRIEKEPPLNKIEGVNFVLLNTEEKAKAIEKELLQCSYIVGKVEKKEKKRNPEAPFTTSTLQQEASRHLRFSPAKTMQIAQTLYEGVDLGVEGAEGLITYMRTDSVRIVPEALQEVRSYILQKYGKEFLPDEVRTYQVKKSAQDAHEAIRPTNLAHDPETIEQFLSRDQYLLYSLIWKRYIACQMQPAIYDTISADIKASDRFLLRATGSRIKFPGFLSVYEEKQDEDISTDEGKMLPPLEEGDLLKYLKINTDQSFTKPPPRFTEASLVKELEKSGIGRPSTYAQIMNKIQSRDYTVKEQGRLKPTELGILVIDMLEASFNKIIDIGFTANMEDNLELVAEHKKEWKNLLSDFWQEFNPMLKTAETESFVPKLETDLICPKCGGKIQKIWSKSKYFLGCENYPTCDYTSSIEEFNFNKNDYAENFDWTQKCAICQSDMKLRFGRFGPFLGCTRYPDCKGIVNIPKKGETVLDQTEKYPCPAIGCTGNLMQRRSRFGKIFYSCSEFPACDVIGNEIEAIREKYKSHVKTAYVKQKTQRRGMKKTVKKTTATKKVSRAAPKKTAVKKVAAKKPAARKPAAKKTAAKR